MVKGKLLLIVIDHLDYIAIIAKLRRKFIDAPNPVKRFASSRSVNHSAICRRRVTKLCKFKY